MAVDGRQRCTASAEPENAAAGLRISAASSALAGTETVEDDCDATMGQVRLEGDDERTAVIGLAVTYEEWYSWPRHCETKTSTTAVSYDRTLQRMKWR